MMVNDVKSQSKTAAMTAEIPLCEAGKDSTLKKELDSLLLAPMAEKTFPDLTTALSFSKSSAQSKLPVEEEKSP